MTTSRQEKNVQRINGLLEIYDEKLGWLNRALAIETDVSTIVKHNHEVAEVRRQIDALERELDTWLNLAPAKRPKGSQRKTEVSPITIKLQMFRVPTGYYHLLRSNISPLISITISNKSAVSMTLVCSTQIIRYSDPEVHRVICAPGQKRMVDFLPSLVYDQVSQISEVRQATIEVKVETADSGHLVEHTTFPIELHARNTALFANRGVAKGTWLDLTDYLAAWVTPNQPAIQEFLNVVRQKHPRKTLVGYQGGHNEEERRQIVHSQIQAIFEALQDTGAGYINSIINFGTETGQVMQRIRLPRESLRDKGMNCIDGTVLFASLMLAISLVPALIIVPGHAFVGWRIWSDKVKYEALETTLVATGTFASALAAGNAHYSARLENGDLERPIFDSRGFLKRIDLLDVINLGITPQE